MLGSIAKQELPFSIFQKLFSFKSYQGKNDMQISKGDDVILSTW